MVVAGLTVGLISLLGDHVGIGQSAAFSLHRQWGLVCGILLVCLGAFWRIDVIGVVGGMLVALAFSTKILHLAGMNGFGWKHRTALVVGFLLVIAGVVVRHLYHRRLAGRTRQAETSGQATHI